MARHVGKHGARHSLWGGVAVFVVIALTGFLLSTNVRVNRTVAATNDTADLVEQGVDEANQLQQDVESVVNALWAGGADALMIMDQRVLFNSAVICSGNVLSLHGKKYSPPFTISAIGDPQRLRAALNDSEAITILKQYVTAFGIGYKVENAEDLQFPATAALLQQLKYATVDTSKTTDEEQTQQ